MKVESVRFDLLQDRITYDEALHRLAVLNLQGEPYAFEEIVDLVSRRIDAEERLLQAEVAGHA